VEKVDTAVLSTTLKAKMRARKTEKEKAEKEGGDLMDMDHPVEEEVAEKMETDEVVEEEEPKKKKKAKKEEEPSSEILCNLSRVVPAQLKYISFPEGSRYIPVKKVLFPRGRTNVAHWRGFHNERLETRRRCRVNRNEGPDR
jgi:26S proteasome regulatory subunit N2